MFEVLIDVFVVFEVICYIIYLFIYLLCRYWLVDALK